MDATEISKIETITGISELGEPTIRGQWATWDQRGSHGLMQQRIRQLKDAGYAAFFSAADRRWGVKI